jgi:hypothetical protein
MRRREFIGLLGGVAGALTCADVFAAQISPKARIGILSPWTWSRHPRVQIVSPRCVPGRNVLDGLRFEGVLPLAPEELRGRQLAACAAVSR